jgi:hypothetical protein
MDVHDVADQYREYLQRQKQTFEKAKQRQGEKPRDRKSREYAHNELMQRHTEGSPDEQMTMVHSSFTPPAYPPCIMSVADLQRVTICDLRLETHHRGTYLLLQTITPPRRLTAVMVIVEDEKGDAALLSLY